MQSVNMSVIIVVIIAAVALMVFLIIRNKKDRKTLRPDANSAIEEEIKREEDKGTKL